MSPRMMTPIDHFLVPAQDADPVVITDDGGRVLLAFRKDGSVDGAIEDAGEAARIFMRHLRENYGVRF